MSDLPALPVADDGTPDLRGLDLLRRPVWVFDPAAPRMVHANAAALRLWRCPSLAAFLARDVSVASEPVRIRTEAALIRLARGEVLQDRLTLYPDGQAVTVEAVTSGLRLPNGGIAMLIEARTLDLPPRGAAGAGSLAPHAGAGHALRRGWPRPVP